MISLWCINEFLSVPNGKWSTTKLIYMYSQRHISYHRCLMYAANIQSGHSHSWCAHVHLSTAAVRDCIRNRTHNDNMHDLWEWHGISERWIYYSMHTQFWFVNIRACFGKIHSLISNSKWRPPILLYMFGVLQRTAKELSVLNIIICSIPNWGRCICALFNWLWET